MRMHEVALTVDQANAQSVIGRLVGLAPYGILDQPVGSSVILRIRGAAGELRTAAEYARLAGGALLSLAEREVPDEWADRRRLDYEPLIVAGICVRPPWAPVTEGVIDLVIDDGEAFGTGAHVTTRASLALLCELAAGGPLADLGSGTGILSVAAAKRGFGPVIAVDTSAPATAATRAAAVANRVEVDVMRLDLLAEAPPFAPVICANVPVAVHAAIAARIPDWPDFVIASGFACSDLEAVSSFYARLGLAPGCRIDGDGWTTCLFSADSAGWTTD
jgi:ribosomal protein L11 methyltransferase